MESHVLTHWAITKQRPDPSHAINSTHNTRLSGLQPTGISWNPTNTPSTRPDSQDLASKSLPSLPIGTLNAMSNIIVPTQDGTLTLRSLKYGQTFHSEYGAKTEAVHVYLNGTAVYKVLAAHHQAHVLEVGFGAGLNFMLTAALAHGAGERLHYLAIDKCIPDARTLESLKYGEVARMPDLWAWLIKWRGAFGSTVPDGRYMLTPMSNCQLELIIGDATTASLPKDQFDAVYLDAFAPRSNPELWEASFLARLYDATGQGGKLATFSVAGTARRGLTKAGFIVKRRPGPPGKRHCLSATKPHERSVQG